MGGSTVCVTTTHLWPVFTVHDLNTTHAILHSIHCKNKLVVLTTEWLPWLQTSQRDSGYVLYILLITCIVQGVFSLALQTQKTHPCICAILSLILYSRCA